MSDDNRLRDDGTFALTGNTFGPSASVVEAPVQFSDTTGRNFQAGALFAINAKDPQWGAVGNNSGNDQPAIQAAIDFMNSNFGGGIVYLSPGNYKITSTITIKGGVQLIGSGRTATAITASGDITAVAFDASCSYAALKDIFVVGFLNVSAAQNCVTVAQGVPVVISGCSIWGGNAGLFNAGVDGLVENCYIQGYVNMLSSTGANWYIRDKFDAAGLGASPTNGFLQGAYFTAGVAENHFLQCDFSGNFTHAVNINDTNGTTAITIFEGCVFSQGILVTNAKWTCFSACEIGSTSLVVGANLTSISGCFAFAATTVSGAGKRIDTNSSINLT